MATVCKVGRTVANSSAAADSTASDGGVNRATARAQFSGNILAFSCHKDAERPRGRRASGADAPADLEHEGLSRMSDCWAKGGNGRSRCGCFLEGDPSIGSFGAATSSLLTVAQESFRIEPARVLLAPFRPLKVRLERTDSAFILNSILKSCFSPAEFVPFSQG